MKFELKKFIRLITLISLFHFSGFTALMAATSTEQDRWIDPSIVFINDTESSSIEISEDEQKILNELRDDEEDEDDPTYV